MKYIDVMMDERALSASHLAQTSRLPLERVRAIIEGRWLPSPEERSRLAAALNVGVAEVAWGHSMNPRNVRYHRFGLSQDFHADGR